MKATLRHLAALCGIAGYVDAVGYFNHGHVFTANMTGNTVLLGASLMRGDPIVMLYAGTLFVFMLGVVAAVAVKRSYHSLYGALFLNASILLGLCLIPAADTIVLLGLAFAMGIQGGTITMFSGYKMPTIVVTSTLVNLIEGIVSHASPVPEEKPPAADQLKHLAGAWVAYGAGGAAAVLAQNYVLPLLLPVLVYFALGYDVWQRRRALGRIYR